MLGVAAIPVPGDNTINTEHREKRAASSESLAPVLKDLAKTIYSKTTTMHSTYVSKNIQVILIANLKCTLQNSDDLKEIYDLLN